MADKNKVTHLLHATDSMLKPLNYEHFKKNYFFDGEFGKPSIFVQPERGRTIFSSLS